MKKIIVDVCCAPCLCGVYPQIRYKYDEIYLVYNNDNMCCKKEFDIRLDYVYEYAKLYNIKNLIVLDYNHKKWLEYIKGTEQEKEGGARCLLCFKYRFLNLKNVIKETGINLFTTTLTISPYKNFKIISKIANEVEQEINAKYEPYNFKKKDWYKKSIKISKALRFYRQKFCGCEFSLRDSIKK